jgi:5-methylthioadenosine/S-adenosylhomocysteine deaminase
MRRLMTRLLLGMCLLARPALAAADGGPVLIGGTIVAADRVIPNGWIAVQNGKILSISEAKPVLPGARTIATHDIVFPGLVDLHNHPLYAVFPRW